MYNDINFIVDWADSILFIILLIEVVYLLFLGSTKQSVAMKCRIDKYYRYAVLIPKGYTFPQQDYLSENFEVFQYNNWRTEIKEIDYKKFDMAVVIGPYITLPSNLLSTLNIGNNNGFKAMQLHTILSKNNSYALRKAMRLEELRNGLFKSGHCGIGLSSALDKENFAIPLEWAQKHIKTDKTNLEWALTSNMIFIKYLSEPKIVANQFPDHFRQRSIKRSFTRLCKYLFSGNWEEIERDLRRLCPSIGALIIITFIMGISLIFYEWEWSIKWWILQFCTFFALSLAMPDCAMEPHKSRMTLNPYKIWKTRRLKQELKS
jgi:hypothetical protein